MITRKWMWVALTAVLAVPSAGLPQGRTLKKIEPKRPPRTESANVAIPPEVCVAAVHRIAAAWAEARLEEVLHQDFPNRAELGDAIRRASVRGNNIALAVESVPSTRFTTPETRNGRQVTDCVADVVTRLLFDDPVTGERKLGDAGRAQWRIQFEVPARGVTP